MIIFWVIHYYWTDKFSIGQETSKSASNTFLADTESEFSIPTVPYKKSI